MNKKILILLIFLFFTVVVFAENYSVYTPGEINPNITSAKEKTLFILDYSNSMYEYINGVPKIELLMRTMQKILPTTDKKQEIGLRIYGHRMGFTAFDACKASKLVSPITQGNAFNIEMALTKLSPKGMTPITYSLKQAIKNDFGAFDGEKHIILLTDGGENCDESPCKYAMELVKTRKDIKIDVIAFNINNLDDLEQLKCTALVTSGKFHSANTQAELFKSLNKSLNIQKNVEAKIVPNY